MVTARIVTSRKLGFAFVCRRLPFLLFGWMLSIVVLSSYKMVSQVSLSSSSPFLPPKATTTTTTLSSNRNTSRKRNHHGSDGGGGGLPNVDKWKQQSQVANTRSAIKHDRSPILGDRQQSGGNDIAPLAEGIQRANEDPEEQRVQNPVTDNRVNQTVDIVHETITESTARGMKDDVATKDSVANSEIREQVQSDIHAKNDNDDIEALNTAPSHPADRKNVEAASPASEGSENSIFPESENTVNEIEDETSDTGGEAQSGDGSTDSKVVKTITNNTTVDSLKTTKETTQGEEVLPNENTNNISNDEIGKPTSKDEEKKLEESNIDTQSEIQADVEADNVNDSANRDAEKQTGEAATPLSGEKADYSQEATKTKENEKSSSNTASFTKMKGESAARNFRKAVKKALKANGRHHNSTTKKHINLHAPHTAATKTHHTFHTLHNTASNKKHHIVNAADSDIKDFAKNRDVVIAVKIHGPPHVIQLKQSLCLLTKAYNNRPNHDILVFVTDPLSNIHVQELRDIVHPAKLTVETDKKTLSRHIREMTPNQTAALLEQCGKNSTDELFWWTRCGEEKMPLAYNWQAEFRSKWIWYNKELAKYKWMMWYDSDAMATRVWDQDPVAFAIRNELKILFDHFPQGHRAHHELRGMMQDAYNGDYVCHVNLVNGHLEAYRPVGGCDKPNIPQIHGFFHITDLDFYRSDANLKWFDNMIADRKFSRMWDDQIAVTVPAAVLAANKSWDMHQNGVWLDVYHNQHFDGDRNRRHRGGGFKNWWKTLSKTKFPEAVDSCGALVKNSG